MWLTTERDGIHRLQSLRPGTGSVDVEALFSALDDTVKEIQGFRYLIDLTGVVFVSSKALATLIATIRHVHSSGGRMAMVNVHQFVATVLRTMRIIRLVPIFEVEDEALAYLA